MMVDQLLLKTSAHFHLSFLRIPHSDLCCIANIRRQLIDKVVLNIHLHASCVYQQGRARVCARARAFYYSALRDSSSRAAATSSSIASRTHRQAEHPGTPHPVHVGEHVGDCLLKSFGHGKRYNARAREAGGEPWRIDLSLHSGVAQFGSAAGS